MAAQPMAMDTTSESKHGQKRAGEEQGSEAHKQARTEASPSPGQKYSLSTEILRVLMRTKAEDFAIGGKPEKMPIFVCDKTDKLTDVWRGMMAKNFMSVPVMNKDEKTWFGMLDLADIVKDVVKHFGRAKLDKDQDVWAMINEEDEFKKHTVREVIPYPVSRHNIFKPITRGYSAMAVFETLARESNLFRVPIIDEDRQMFNLVTQSQVIAWLHGNKDKLGTIVNKPLSDIPALFGKVVKVKENTEALAAFELMLNSETTSVAVVDEHDKLTGALSLRDLKLLSSDLRMLHRLRQHVKDFTRHLRSEWQNRSGRPVHVCHLSPENTLGEAIEMLAENKIHRVFITQDKQPIGQIALRDVLISLLASI